MNSQSVKIKGYKVTLIETDSGNWYSQSGAGHSGPHQTRDQAIRGAANEINKANDRDLQESRVAKERQKRIEQTTKECPVCRVRVTNLSSHQKSARHKNALAYENYRHTSRY